MRKFFALWIIVAIIYLTVLAIIGLTTLLGPNKIINVLMIISVLIFYFPILVLAYNLVKKYK